MPVSSPSPYALSLPRNDTRPPWIRCWHRNSLQYRQCSHPPRFSHGLHIPRHRKQDCHPFPSLGSFSPRYADEHPPDICAAAMAAIMPAAPPPITITLLISILFCRSVRPSFFLAPQGIVQHRFIIYKVDLIIQIYLIIIPGLFQCLQIFTHLLRTFQAQCHYQRIDHA